MILNVPFFRLFPSQVVQRLVCAVRVEFYMPDDYIILVGEFGHEMFFIKSGTVDVFRIDEAEVQVTRDAFIALVVTKAQNRRGRLVHNAMDVGTEAFFAALVKVAASSRLF